jgi:hypothetical protein
VSFLLSVTYNPFILSVVMLNGLILSVVMQNVLILSVIMLSVAAPMQPTLRAGPHKKLFSGMPINIRLS